jgi:hypothetical protein
MDGRASLYAVTFCSFCKGRLVPLILNTRLKTHQKNAKLLLVVLSSGLCWRASWQLASRVCIKHCKADRNVPLCTYLHRIPRYSGLSLLLLGGPVFRTRTGYPDEMFSCFFSFPRGNYRNCTSYLATIISLHVLPNLITHFSLFILTSYVV